MLVSSQCIREYGTTGCRRMAGNVGQSLIAAECDEQPQLANDKCLPSLQYRAAPIGAGAVCR
jgi:hypothetical protein